MVTTRRQKQAEAQEATSPARNTRSQKRRADGGKKLIYSWNMQGATISADKLSVLRKRLRNPKTFAVVLQECGGLGGWTPEQVERDYPGFQLLLREWSAEAGATGTGNSRCSMAILARGTVLGQNEITPTSDRRRPIINTRFPTMQIANFHAPRSNPAFATEVMNRSFLGHDHTPTFFVGDFNLTPSDLHVTPNDTEIIASGSATHIKGKEIDFAVASEALEASFAGSEMVGGSDHALMSYEVNIPT